MVRFEKCMFLSAKYSTLLILFSAIWKKNRLFLSDDHESLDFLLLDMVVSMFDFQCKLGKLVV